MAKKTKQSKRRIGIKWENAAMKPIRWMFAFGLIFVSGCTFNTGMVITPATLGPNEKVMGIVSGQSEKKFLFGGLFSWGDDSLQTAMLDALSRSKFPAQGLNNVFAEKSCTYIPILPGIFWWCNTSLTGAAIQYTDLGNLRLRKTTDDTAEMLPLGEIPSPDESGKKCPKGERFHYGQCYPTNPIVGSPKPSE